MEEKQLVDWMPFAIRWEGPEPVVDWCYLGDHRFREPFFDQAIQQRQRHPKYREWHRVTPLDVLFDQNATQTGVHPTGFIFHTARCGSTLIAQMLAASPENIAISEASIFSSVFGANAPGLRLGEDGQVELVRAIVHALGRRRNETEKRYFIKFSRGSILELPLIQRAFPDVPWIFVYRDPLEVLVAHLQHSVDRLPPGVIESGLVPDDPVVLRQMSPAEFWARVLARRCAAALGFREYGKSLLVNYAQLPGIVWKALSDFFGVTFSAEDIARMVQVAKFNAKDPSTLFTGDSQTKRQAATDAMRAAVDRWVMPYYQRLESIRLSQVA